MNMRRRWEWGWEREGRGEGGTLRLDGSFLAPSLTWRRRGTTNIEFK
jgi:hypothetical protein